MIVSRETLNSKKREQKEDSSKVLFHVKGQKGLENLATRNSKENDRI